MVMITHACICLARTYQLRVFAELDDTEAHYNDDQPGSAARNRVR
jgi:hypothetical protein